MAGGGWSSAAALPSGAAHPACCLRYPADQLPRHAAGRAALQPGGPAAAGGPGGRPAAAHRRRKAAPPAGELAAAAAAAASWCAGVGGFQGLGRKLPNKGAASQVRCTVLASMNTSHPLVRGCSSCRCCCHCLAWPGPPLSPLLCFSFSHPMPKELAYFALDCCCKELVESTLPRAPCTIPPPHPTQPQPAPRPPSFAGA